MKSKDWSLIVVIVFISAVVSFAVSNFTIGSLKTNKIKVEVVKPLTDNFPLPNNKYFEQSTF